MIKIKYICNKEVVSSNFPKQLSEIKKEFNDNKITLANSQDFIWLDNFKEKTLNVYNLNYLCKLVSINLDYKDIQKLNAISSIKNFGSLNDLIHTINHLNYYGLIVNKDYYHDSITLAKELFNQIYNLKIPKDLAIPKTDSEWQYIGDRCKEKLVKHKTDYGWLFHLDKIPALNENEIPVFKTLDKAQVSAWIINSQNKQKLILDLPQYGDQLIEHLHRADIYNELAVIFDFKSEDINYTLFKQTQRLMRQAKISEVNNFCKTLQDLNKQEIQFLITILNKYPASSITKLIHISQNLGDILLLENSQLKSDTYAKERLKMLMSDNFSQYQAVLDKFLDYQAVGDYLLNKEAVINSKLGNLMLPKSLKFLIEDNKE